MKFLTGLISKFPFFGTATAFLVSKGRLIIEYIMIAVIISMAGVAFTMWSAKNVAERERVALAQKAAQLAIQSEIHVATINNLKTLRKKDENALVGLLADYKQLSSSDAVTRTKLKELEAKNEDVRLYLSQPIPAGLVCLLNGTCADSASSSGGVPATPRGAPVKGRTPSASRAGVYPRLS